jgi:hypothetical protein
MDFFFLDLVIHQMIFVDVAPHVALEGAAHIGIIREQIKTIVRPPKYSWAWPPQNIQLCSDKWI